MKIALTKRMRNPQTFDYTSWKLFACEFTWLQSLALAVWQPSKANSAFHPSGVGKWVPASAGKAKAGMVHSVNGWTRGVQIKLWDPLRTRAIPECLRGAFTTRRYTNPRLPLPLPLALTAAATELLIGVHATDPTSLKKQQPSCSIEPSTL